MTENVDLSIKRDALVSQLYSVDNVDVIEKVQRALNKAMAAVKQAAVKKVEKDDVEYIGKEELEDVYLNAFTELCRAKKEGWKLKSAEELLHEL